MTPHANNHRMPRTAPVTPANPSRRATARVADPLPAPTQCPHITAIPEGAVLIMAHRQITDDEGHGEVFTSPPTSPNHIPADVQAMNARQAETIKGLRAALLQAASGQGVEPTHWRAVLAEDQRPHELRIDRHTLLFRKKPDAESWVASALDFDGWRYTLEPLYLGPPAAPALVQLSKQEIDKLIPAYFSEGWAIEQAVNLIDHYTKLIANLNGLTVGGDGGQEG